jgi:hypothetical protein
LLPGVFNLGRTVFVLCHTLMPSVFSENAVLTAQSSVLELCKMCREIYLRSAVKSNAARRMSFPLSAAMAIG